MLIWTLAFTLCLSVFGSTAWLWWYIAKEKRIQNLAREVAHETESGGAAPVVLTESPEFRSPMAQWLASRESSTMETRGWSQRGFLWLTAGMAAAGIMLGIRLMSVLGPAAPVLAGGGCAVIPRVLRNKRRRKQLALYEFQFPDALDFLSRSMRAGNAFSVSVELLAAETTEPLRAEIARVTHEMALGGSLQDSLEGFARRVPLLEIRFFVSAVLLQRETGGNLSEILGKLSISVRERLRLRGQVHAASGQGRLTASVLTILPIATLLLLNLLSPSYAASLTSDPVGRNLLAGAAFSQLLGYLCMKKIVDIEV